MLTFDRIADERIREAIARGDFDDLPGAGRPLALADDALVPDELRVAWRILKNAGYVPPEIEALREIGELERFVLAGDSDAAARSRAVKRLSLLRARIETGYTERVLGRLGG